MVILGREGKVCVGRLSFCVVAGFRKAHGKAVV